MTRLAFLLVGLIAGFALAVIVSAEDEPPVDGGWRDWAPGADFV